MGAQSISDTCTFSSFNHGRLWEDYGNTKGAHVHSEEYGTERRGHRRAVATSPITDTWGEHVKG